MSEYARVTHIITDILLPENFYKAGISQLRGEYVHLAVKYYVDGILDEENLDQQLRPYLNAFKKWLETTKPKILETEKELVDETLGFMGHLDLVAEINGEQWIIDIKTGAKASWHIIQLAAYHYLYTRNFKLLNIANLYLTDDEAFEFRPYQLADMVEAWELFKSALACYKFRQSQRRVK